MKRNPSPNTIQYDEFAEWLDSIFCAGVPSNVTGIVFNIYEESDCRHYIEAAGYSSSIENGDQWMGGESADCGTRMNPYWMEKTSWDVVLITEEDLLSATKSSLEKYLKIGKCANILKAVDALAVRLEHGNLEMVYIKN